LDKHLDKVLDIFWIKSLNGTFLALQINAFGPKKNQDFMQGLKSAILAICQNGLGWLCPVGAAIKNPLQESKNSFCFGCRLIPRKTGK
jgi:hypothetical protein